MINSTLAYSRDILIAADGAELPGMLVIPEGAAGIVLFAHGSGSSRRSARNRFVATVLQSAGLGTVLFDLLTEREAGHRRNVFDMELLAGRVLSAARWLMSNPATCELSVGLFGASTGAGAALAAAAQEPLVRAVVSRGGRPDLAGAWLESVRAPTLLIVGGLDREVLTLNQDALARLRCEKELTIVTGATHLFEEPGTLEEAARRAQEWFTRHLREEGPP